MEQPGFEESLSPFDELEMLDLHVREAGLDEEATMFDPDEHPKTPHTKEEAITDLEGKRDVDIMRDTPPVDVLAAVDLSESDLRDLDVV